MTTALFRSEIDLVPKPNLATDRCLQDDSGEVGPDPRAVPVRGVRRKIIVKVASTAEEWEQAFRLVRQNYLDSGYEPPSTKLLRFTLFHALPETTVFIAKLADEVVGTFTLVPDNRPLGLPLEGLYEDEVEELRRQGRHLAEVTSLAAKGLTQREFGQVFQALIRLNMQYHDRQGGDTWVLTVNPRHSQFYCKVLGCRALGPRRAYERVQGHPAEAYWLDRTLLRNVPKMYEQIFGESLSAEVVAPVRMPVTLIRSLANKSSLIDVLDVDQVLRRVERGGKTRAW